MFERNKVDNIPELSAIAIEATLDDGTVLKGKVAIPQHKTIYDALNGPVTFLEFETFDGDRRFIAKATLRTVKLLAVGRGPNLTQRLRDADGFDPHTILGLSRTATWEDVKSAFHRLSKMYHPDRAPSCRRKSGTTSPRWRAASTLPTPHWKCRIRRASRQLRAARRRSIPHRRGPDRRTIDKIVSNRSARH